MIAKNEMSVKFIEPVQGLDECEHLGEELHDQAEDEFIVVFFQAGGNDDEVDGKGRNYFILEDIARRESFLIEETEIIFFWIEDQACL